MDTNYFVCTLGQATALNHDPKPYQTISEFLSHQSKNCGPKPAVGFPIPRREGNWNHQVLNFQDIDNATQLFAQRLSKAFELVHKTPETVALLCHSSPEFLFTWLGLMRLGHPVLLLAPQCQPSAILHLCKSCNVSLLLHDDAHSQRASEAEKLGEEENETKIEAQLIPIRPDEDIFDLVHEPVDFSLPNSVTNPSSVAYLHHTSGTSSGLPKPISQTHRAAIGVLPRLSETPCKAAFTTTPLYHGGIADAFRSWTSDSLIWLFPSKDVPITARNICSSFDAAGRYSSSKDNPQVKYFSSVPYVLQMMEADSYGLEILKKMDIVGVGGAALPTEVGDRLVDHGVNLISRFGSAECGFLLSSYRDFAADKEWRYLRNYNPIDTLNFERYDDDLAELVVKPGWPHMARTNRNDSSFATADLFARHSKIENAWSYHSRADSQLTLITGKKFDPAPLEAAIATSPHLADVLIFGNGRPYPGALLLRTEKSREMTDTKLNQAVWPSIKKLNQESQDHARIPQHMLSPIPYQEEPLQKSSKGTIIRKVAEARFADYINASYKSKDEEQESITDEKVSQHLVGLIKEIVPNSKPLTENTDLFSYGVDSIACMRLRNRLQRLTPKYQKELPLSIIEDCGTVKGLSDYVIRKRNGAPDVEVENEEQLMLDLVKEYGSFESKDSTPRKTMNGQSTVDNTERLIVLTGATGALGAHILDILRRSNDVTEIYCLVRGADKNAARGRVSKALEQRGLDSLSENMKLNDKIKVVQAQLGEAQLGLSDALYHYLAAKADLILHIAWTVNFRLKLRSFVKDNIAGVRNLIDLSMKTERAQPPLFAYCSSTAAIINSMKDQKGYLAEILYEKPSSASPLGYSRSKWVAEQICLQAHCHTSLRGRVSIIRVGQLAGDSQTGIWNTMEAWPMMLSTSRLIGCLPDLADEPLDWLPVDIAAKAFLEAAQHKFYGDRMEVSHVLNPHQNPTWREMLEWLKKRESFDIVSPQDWVLDLEQSEQAEHSAMKLLGLWKETYCGAKKEKKPRARFSIARTQERAPVLRDIRPIDEVYISKVWDWVQMNVQ